MFDDHAVVRNSKKHSAQDIFKELFPGFYAEGMSKLNERLLEHNAPQTVSNETDGWLCVGVSVQHVEEGHKSSGNVGNSLKRVAVLQLGFVSVQDHSRRREGLGKSVSKPHESLVAAVRLPGSKWMASNARDGNETSGAAEPPSVSICDCQWASQPNNSLMLMNAHRNVVQRRKPKKVAVEHKTVFHTVDGLDDFPGVEVDWLTLWRPLAGVEHQRCHFGGTRTPRKQDAGCERTDFRLAQAAQLVAAVSKDLFNLVHSFDILGYALQPVDHRPRMVADSVGSHFDGLSTPKRGVCARWALVGYALWPHCPASLRPAGSQNGK
jgi:hypothetical protein